MAFSAEFSIAGRAIGRTRPCFVIAEGGVNHFGDLEKAYALVDLAVAAKADAFKLQHFVTDRLVGARSPEWRARLRPKELRNEDVRKVRDYCNNKGILFLCTAHDDLAFQFIDEELDVPAHKIGSGEIQNWPFLERIARTGKPVLLSTGMYELHHIREATAVLADAGCHELGILHCVTEYPTDPLNVNLSVMQQIREFFDGPVGYSDHTVGTAVPLAAVALGAAILEKHITLDRDVPNAQDWKVSCDATNFVPFLESIRAIESAKGTAPKRLSEGERKSLGWARKSLVLANALPAGTALKPEHLLAQRPGDGIPPSELKNLLGRRICREVSQGELLTEEMLSPSDGSSLSAGNGQ